MEYAIVDIETTGGHAGGSSIIEIAIRVFDGEAIIDSYETLIKPDHAIPLFITALTGIDYEMLQNCPSFDDIAGEVFERLSGRVFVAHNVNFDYSFIKYHLANSGFVLNTPKLCTVRMARKIQPGLKSYSLGNLCDNLNIAINDRHRAGGDVDATVVLFTKLMQWDDDGIINAMLKKGSKEQLLPPNLPIEEFERLPNKTGVYYFHNDKGKVIYIGKAKDIKKRIGQHFTGNNPNPQRQNFMREIFSVTYELCGTELMAFILEAIEIKRIYPKYNSALKRYEPKFGLFVYDDLQGYKRMIISKFNKNLLPVKTYTTYQGGVNKLKDLIMRFGLCAALCKLGRCESCDLIDKKNDLVCTASLSPAIYNERAMQALSYLKEDSAGFYIIDKGRDENEKSCIWVEHGNFYGMGYINNERDIYSREDIKDSITTYSDNYYIMQLIVSFICKYPDKVVNLKSQDVSVHEV